MAIDTHDDHSHHEKTMMNDEDTKTASASGTTSTVPGWVIESGVEESFREARMRLRLCRRRTAAWVFMQTPRMLPYDRPHPGFPFGTSSVESVPTHRRIPRRGDSCLSFETSFL